MTEDENDPKRQAYLEKRRANYQKNKEKIKEQNKRSREKHMDSYLEYNEKWRKENPEKVAAKHKRWRDKNVDAERERVKKWHQENPDVSPAWHRAKRKVDPIKYMLYDAKKRAKKQGLPFDLEHSDFTLPEFCPVLGIKLVARGNGHSWNSFSIDKIIPELGYVKGNVMIISWRANVLKKDATPEEIMAVAQYAARETERVRKELLDAD